MAEAPNWKMVSPQSKAKLSGILKWARKQRHPHREAVKALVKRGVSPERAAKIAAVMKDMSRGGTGWRGGDKG